MEHILLFEKFKRRPAKDGVTVGFSDLDRYEIPDEILQMMKGWDVIRKSPYSNSFYSSTDITWDYKPDGSYRVADHWNFQTKNSYKVHCPTFQKVENTTHVSIGKWDGKNQKYDIILSVKKPGVKSGEDYIKSLRIDGKELKERIKKGEIYGEVKIKDGGVVRGKVKKYTGQEVKLVDEEDNYVFNDNYYNYSPINLYDIDGNVVKNPYLTKEGHIISFDSFTRLYEMKQGTDLTGTMVSNNGEPIPVYHGTYADFDKFDMSWQGQTDEGFYGRGFYFTLEKEHAAEYGSKVLECFLDIKNPFYLRTWNTIGSYEEIELREDLVKLKGVDPDIRPIRTLPKGYELKVEEDRHYRGDVVTRIGVYPKKELWDSEDVVYGDDIYLRKEDAKDPVKLKGYSELAIVQFNDLLNGVELKSGLASWLLQSLDRWNFTDLLEKNGYDGLFVVGNKGQETPIEEVKEILVWNTDQIHIIR